MSGRRLRERLGSAPLPGEDEARERAWRVASAAYAARPAAERRPRRRRSGLALAAGLALALLALSLPAVAVGTRLLRSLGGTQLRETPLRIPAPGRLLAVSSAGTFVVHADGDHRRLGPFSSASWSPHGLNVLVEGGAKLRGVAPWSAQMRWPRALGTGERIEQAAWSRWDGWRVAYIAGRTLRVANGDGTGDHAVATPGAPTALAWRPLPGHARHELAVASSTRSLSLREEGLRETVRWSRRLPAAPVQLDWSADGGRLAALLPGGSVVLLDGRGRWLRTLAADATRIAFAPRGRRLALIQAQPGRQSALEVRTGSGSRLLYASRAPLSSLAWSPDGTFVVVAAPRSDAWIFVPVAGTRLTFAQPASRLFGGGRFPQVAGWAP